MELLDAIRGRRSIRRFKQAKVDDATLLSLVEAATLAPSGGNAQPLRYVIVRSPAQVKSVFDLVAWAAHVRPRRTPVWGANAPAAFIAVCATAGADNALVFADAGAAIQSMLLRAVDLGLGCCWLGAFNKGKADETLKLKDLNCVFLVAVGCPDESPVLESISLAEPTAYHLDGDDVLHVPKHSVSSVTELC